MHWSRRGVVANVRSRWVEHYIQDCRDAVTISDVSNLSSERAEKLVWGAAPAEVAAISRQLTPRLRERFEVTVTDDFFIEFTSPQATKAAGVAAVASYHNIDPAHVLTFGDGNNDVSMLKWAGLGVAMSHARPAARAAAAMIAPPGDPESSLARAVHAVLEAAGMPTDTDRPTPVAA
jgi:hydroxymethylpyrimidine pyrophosphatase-like HAD family hydrolase